MTNLYINDLFWTLQGEGLHWGRRSLFVRMPYCNLACSWCDTTFDTFKRWPIDEFKSFALSEPARFAVVTGGEPLMHAHTNTVLDTLQELGFSVACETNGTIAPNDLRFDWVTCSPKRDANYKVHPELYSMVSEFKYVVDDKFDFSILDRHTDDPKHVRLRLSPEFGDMQTNVNKIIDYIKEHPRWTLNLQTHKFIGIP